MVWLIRMAAYVVSGFTIWQFVQGGAPDMTAMGRHMALDQVHSMILGVCAGVSNYTGIDVSLLRLIFVIAACYKGFGIALYVLAFLILPVS
ncbi:MAG: PspC domain-containing protein [Pelosinus sp.]|nr:PspC domain-containing protein [Pelosinus sp.]